MMRLGQFLLTPQSRPSSHNVNTAEWSFHHKQKGVHFYKWASFVKIFTMEEVKNTIDIENITFTQDPAEQFVCDSCQ